MIARLLHSTGSGRLAGTTAAERRKYLSKVEQASRRRAKFSPVRHASPVNNNGGKRGGLHRDGDYTVGKQGVQHASRGGAQHHQPHDEPGVHANLRPPLVSSFSQRGAGRGMQRSAAAAAAVASASTGGGFAPLRYDAINPRSGNSILQERFDALAKHAILTFCPRSQNELRLSELFRLLRQAKPDFSVKVDADGLPLAVLAKNCCYLQSHSGYLHFIRVTAAASEAMELDDDNETAEDGDAEGAVAAGEGEEPPSAARAADLSSDDTEDDGGDGNDHADAIASSATQQGYDEESGEGSSRMRRQRPRPEEDLQKFKFRDLRHTGEGLQCGPEPWRYTASMVPHSAASGRLRRPYTD